MSKIQQIVLGSKKEVKALCMCFLAIIKILPKNLISKPKMYSKYSKD